MVQLSPTNLGKWIFCAAALGVLAAGQLLKAADAHSLAHHASQLAPTQTTPAIDHEIDSLDQSSPATPARSSISLAPAVVMVRCKPSQSYRQLLTLTNQTEKDLEFEMVAQDVIVRDGKRSFVLAGATPRSIAATAVFSQRHVIVPSGQSESVGITLTVPPETSLRAAIVLFRGLNKLSGRGPVMMTASLGALFTFTISEDFQIEGSQVAITAQSATANLVISQTLTNTGSEPVIVGGIAALLDEKGRLVGKAAFEEQRLLPGERLPFQAEYPAELKKGLYSVFASFEYEKKVITNSMGFAVP
jgi:hypothetical protein